MLLNRKMDHLVVYGGGNQENLHHLTHSLSFSSILPGLSVSLSVPRVEINIYLGRTLLLLNDQQHFCTKLEGNAFSLIGFLSERQLIRVLRNKPLLRCTLELVFGVRFCILGHGSWYLFWG